MFTCYEPRPIEFLGSEELAGYRLKMYSIVYGGESFERRRFDDGWELAVAELPQPSQNAGRPGIGFAVLHQGRTGDYLILAWWDNENELPIRVFVHDAKGWRPAGGGESVCVWDLQVVAHEREAYVAELLRDTGSIERYLNRVMNVRRGQSPDK